MSIFDQSFDQPSSCFGICNDVRSFTHGPNNSRHHRQQQHDDELLLAREDLQKKKEMDALLAQAMSGLSFEERQEQQEVIHGVAENIVEDAAHMDHALKDLNEHLGVIKNGSMYEVAESMDPSYVKARAFRVMFLRANEYDSKASAEQMIKFFDLKHQLFGVDKLVKDITMQDLDEDDIACLKTGHIQLAGRDRSGRKIFVVFGGLVEESSKTLQSSLRVIYFVVMRALQQSVETQIRGTVSVWYTLGDLRSKTNGKWWFEIFMAARALPKKTAAIHFCVDDMRQFVLTNLVVKVMKSKLRARFRLHLGSLTECRYQLSTYGILPQSLPLNDDEGLNLDRHLQWVHCCAMEDTFGCSISPTEGLLDSSPSARPIIPQQMDVLFTGGKSTSHEGNKSLHLLVQGYSVLYDSGTDETKRQVVSTIVDEIHRRGGRFLKNQGERSSEVVCWKEVPSGEVRQKVMQTFRNRRRQLSRQKVSSTKGPLIEGEPLPNDVIFGRAQRNPGSELLHRLIKDHFEEYESLGRGVKMRLVGSIMQTITDQGGRFLQPALEEGRWLEAPKDTTRERISKYFRNHRRPSKKVLR